MTQRDTPTWFVLDSAQGHAPEEGWRLGDASGLEVTEEGISLATLPAPPSPLLDRDAAFDGLDHPSAVAADLSGTLYLVDKNTHALFRITRPACGPPQCRRVACVGGLGFAPRQFNTPQGIAISARGKLYVADTQNHRIQVFRLEDWGLETIWGGRIRLGPEPAPDPRNCAGPGPRLRPVAGEKPGEFNGPRGIAIGGGGDVHIADTGNGRIQTWRCKTRRFETSRGDTLAAHYWQVLYGSEERTRFVYVPARGRLERWPAKPGGMPPAAGEVTMVQEGLVNVGTALDAVLRALGARGATDLLVAWYAAYPTGLEQAPPLQRPAHVAVDLAGRIWVAEEGQHIVRALDSEGRVVGRSVALDERLQMFVPRCLAVDAAGALWAASGEGLYRFRPRGGGRHCAVRIHGCTGVHLPSCQPPVVVTAGSPWVTTLASVPPFVAEGTAVVSGLDSGLDRCAWHRVDAEWAGPLPGTSSLSIQSYTSNVSKTAVEIQLLPAEEWSQAMVNADRFLIQSPPGRWLWLRIRLRGIGSESPLLRRLKVHFPRMSSLELLPAVYQSDPVSRQFLDRFLSLFDDVLAGIENQIDDVPELFDPAGAPAGFQRGDFLRWLGRWVDLSFQQGWSVATRRLLLLRSAELYQKRGTLSGIRLWIKLAFGIEAQLLEHAVSTPWSVLDGSLRAGGKDRLGGRCISHRMQLDEGSRLGAAALVGSGEPRLDAFNSVAHRFSVVVPARALRAEGAERSLRALIEAEKPAHTCFDLVTVETGRRLGSQPRVGLDFILGPPAPPPLGGNSVLGRNTLLTRGGRPARSGIFRVGRASRVGMTAGLP